MTEYKILVRSRTTPGSLWTELQGSVSASSASAAIRAQLGVQQGDSPQEDEFVAVPARSWKPVKVEREVVTHVRLRAKAAA